MKHPSIPGIALPALLVASLLAAACGEHSTTAPRAFVPTIERNELESVDSAEAIVLPYDGEARFATRTLTALASTSPTIRIGVVQSASTVTLGSAADYVISDKANGLPLLAGSNGTVTVTLAAAPASFYRLQVVCGSTPAVAARKAAAEAAGYVTFTEFVPGANCTRLYLGEFAPPPASTFGARNAFRNQAIATGHAGTDSFWRVVTVGGPTVYRITQGSASAISVNPVVVTSSDGRVLIGGHAYRGTGEVRLNGSGTLAGIDELPLEEYLYGVVPRELGPIQYPEVEALKAQAVAARTFALANLGRRSTDHYDLRATTDDQVYGGFEAEHPLSSRAVDETEGVVATYDGKLIDALYSSTSGGHTADNEESFEGSPLPYLRGVPDAERGAALEHVPTLEVFRSHANPTSLRAARASDFEADWARLHRWTYEWTMPELAGVLASTLGQPITRVDAIDVVERGPSGRALRVAFVTDAGTFTVSKGAIRATLRFLDASGSASNLPSTLFFAEAVSDPRTKAIEGWRVYGAGFGHGVGMAQTGAVGMAAHGASFAEILAHYYQGIALEQRYGAVN